MNKTKDDDFIKNIEDSLVQAGSAVLPSDNLTLTVNILSVDDNVNNLKAIEDLLSSLGQNIISKNSGADALKYLLSNDVAVILLDVMMPEMNGLETAALIRQRNRSKDTPIIFITAATPTREHIVNAYALGAVDYIFKPIVPEILKSKVAVFIELFRKTQALKQQMEEKAQEAKQLRTALQSMQLLSGWQEDSDFVRMENVDPLSKRSPKDFTEIQIQYESLLDPYLEAMGFGRQPPREQINALAIRIGLLNGGPRDVVDVHMRSVIGKCQDVHPAREKAYALEGRLLALEFMGFLVNHYRKLGTVPTTAPITSQRKEHQE